MTANKSTSKCEDFSVVTNWLRLGKLARREDWPNNIFIAMRGVNIKKLIQNHGLDMTDNFSYIPPKSVSINNFDISQEVLPGVKWILVED